MSDAPPQPDADAEWEALLRQLRAQPAAQPRPYFYSRVQARLTSTVATKSPAPRAWLSWPAYAFMLAMLLLLSGDEAALRSSRPLSQGSGQQQPTPVSGR